MAPTTTTWLIVVVSNVKEDRATVLNGDSSGNYSYTSVTALALVIVCLLLFYVLATTKVISGLVLNCDSAASW